MNSDRGQGQRPHRGVEPAEEHVTQNPIGVGGNQRDDYITRTPQGVDQLRFVRSAERKRVDLPNYRFIARGFVSYHHAR